MNNYTFTLLLLLFSFAQAQTSKYDIRPSSLKSNYFMGVKILDSIEVSLDELSALAYKDNRLYAINNLGTLYSFDLELKNSKIESLKLIKTVELKNKKGIKLSKKKRDSEGAVIVGDKLFISFERKPRVNLFSLSGIKIKKFKIDKELRDINNYQGKNRALESMAYSSKYGVLTAPELALKNRNRKFHTIYAKNRVWNFSASGKLSALEFISGNEIMALERESGAITGGKVITLTKVFLDRCEAGVCKSEVLAKLSTKDGWRVGDFEGLTKVDKNRFLMVSDNDGSFFQKTLLVFFEIMD